MYIAKEYGYPIRENEILQILKRYENESSIDSFLLDCLYNSLTANCQSWFSNLSVEYRYNYRTHEERNESLKQAINKLRECVKSFKLWGFDTPEVESHIKELKVIRAESLAEIRTQRINARYRKKTRKEFNRLKPKIKKQLEDNFGSQCVQCSSSNKLEIDHIQPVFKKGDNDIKNLQLLCRECHLIKSANERRA